MIYPQTYITQIRHEDGSVSVFTYGYYALDSLIATSPDFHFFNANTKMEAK